ATPVPTPTPIPTATLTPTVKPTVTLVPTGTTGPHATATPLPTATPTIKVTVTPTLFTSAKQQNGTPTLVAFTSSPTPSTTPVLTLTPTSATIAVVTITPTTVPTATTIPTPTLTLSPTNPALHLVLSLVGIDSSAASPLHTERSVNILVYNSTDDVTNAATTPLQTVQGTVTFDAPSASFVNPTLTLSPIDSGQYQLFVQMPGYIKKQLTIDGNAVISVTSGTATNLPTVKLVAGDIDGNNIVDIADYNGLLRCYGLHIANPSPACANPQASDLNDDGIVDASDYNIFLYSLYAYRQQNNVLPSPTPSPEITATPSATTTPTTIPTISLSPTQVATATPTLIKKVPTRIPTTLPVTPTKPSSKRSIFAGISDNAGILTKIFDILVFIILGGTLLIGIIRSSLFAKLMKKQDPGGKPEPSSPSNTQATPDAKQLKEPVVNNSDSGVVK
ncbi:MAG TPA: dockerin type I repeat-containing protein, partial [Candidatus Saccharimonadales bacterium]|nr:dockerin type I repeat-containing protein [Candidatus Saccharimonadales bacterium]